MFGLTADTPEEQKELLKPIPWLLITTALRNSISFLDLLLTSPTTLLFIVLCRTAHFAIVLVVVFEVVVIFIFSGIIVSNRGPGQTLLACVELNLWNRNVIRILLAFLKNGSKQKMQRKITCLNIIVNSKISVDFMGAILIRVSTDPKSACGCTSKFSVVLSILKASYDRNETC